MRSEKWKSYLQNEAEALSRSLSVSLEEERKGKEMKEVAGREGWRGI